MKKIISFALSAILALSSLPLGISAEDTEVAPYTIDFGAAYVDLYKDQAMETAYRMGDTIPEGTTVYYEIRCREGIECTRIKINSTADTNSFEMPSKLDIELNTVLHGDTDRDNVLTTADVINILQCVSGSWAKFEYPPFGSASNWWDVNCDDRINVADAIAILKHIAGWENALISGGVATSYKLSSLLSDEGIKEYTVLYKGPEGNTDIMLDYGIADIFDDGTEFREMIVRYFNDDVPLYLMAEDGSLSEDAINYLALMETYSDKFFEENTLIVRSQPVENRDISLDRERTYTTVYAQDTSIGSGWIEMVFDETVREEAADGRYVLTFIAVPKGTITSLSAPVG